MQNQCYYCEEVFDSKDKLYDHLNVHSKPKESKQKTLKNKNYSIVCSDCGKNSEVPFQPKHDKPIYCKEYST